MQRWAVEGVGNTRAIVLFASETPPRRVLLDGAALESWQYLPDEQLLYVRYPNEPHPRVLAFEY